MSNFRKTRKVFLKRTFVYSSVYVDGLALVGKMPLSINLLYLRIADSQFTRPVEISLQF